MRKTTTELLKELKNFDTFEEYQKANKESLFSKTLAEYLTELLEERKLKKADVIKKAELGDSYTYQLFIGRKVNPSRDKLICISVAMGLSIDETNSVLKIAGFLPLYPRAKRDSIIIMNINNGKSVVEINEVLYNEGEETLN